MLSLRGEASSRVDGGKMAPVRGFLFLLSWRAAAVFSCSPLWEFPHSARPALSKCTSVVTSASIGRCPRSVALSAGKLHCESMNHTSPYVEIPCFRCDSSPPACNVALGH